MQNQFILTKTLQRITANKLTLTEMVRTALSFLFYGATIKQAPNDSRITGI